MVRAADYSQNVEPQVTRHLAAGLGQCSDQRGCLILPGGKDIDMSDDVNRLRTALRGRPGDREALKDPDLERANKQRLKLVAKRRGDCGLVVGIRRRLVAPRFDQCEAA